MALPREPRQKMINIMYLVLTAILALNVSNEVIEAFKTVDKSLQNSTANIANANNTLYSSLDEKLKDPKTAELAAIWNKKALDAKAMASTLDSYINELKLELKKGAGLVIKSDGKEDFKEDNLDASTRIFETAGKGKDLENKLKAFKEAILNLDPAIRAKYVNSLPIDLNPPIGQDGKKKDFTTAYFHMTPTVAALTMLSKFQNNVKNSENQVVTFCHEQIGAVKVRYDKFGVLVGQSSNYLMPGQELEITAGIGAYSSGALPQISINGSGVAAVDGRGSYKTTVSGSGAHKIPVVIHYKDQNNVDQTSTAEVEYVVGVPGGAAVMLDKMNVFYIGVDNPITISSGSGWDKTTVTPSGCTITGSGSNRVVTVTTVGAASLTVTADGKSSKFDFRVKRVPDPVFKVAGGKPRMPSVEFKNQQFCRAELENFDFDTRFSVVSATVYFSGAGFPNVATSAINSNSLAGLSAFLTRCVPGSVITFDNIKVTGPGGARVIDGKSFALY
jgi:gliding motility-associated protein GldM